MTHTEKILNAYKIKPTITGIRKITGYSWQKIAKTLSSEGIIVNDSQALILELHEMVLCQEKVQIKCNQFSFFCNC